MKYKNSGTFRSQEKCFDVIYSYVNLLSLVKTLFMTPGLWFEQSWMSMSSGCYI